MSLSNRALLIPLNLVLGFVLPGQIGGFFLALAAYIAVATVLKGVLP